MDLKNKSILVTGGGGMLGSYLIRELLHQDCNNIHVIIQEGSTTSLLGGLESKVELHYGDILDIFFLREMMQLADLVFHCAGVISFDPATFNEMKLVNDTGTENVVNACLENHIEKLIHVSSVAAIGRLKSGQTIDENSKWEQSKHNTYYGITKHLSEMHVWRGITEGLTAAIVNPSIILGVGNWETGSTAVFSKVARGLKYVPKGSTSLVDARDVARFMVKLGQSDIQGQRFILNGTNISFLEFFGMIANAMGIKAPRKILSTWQIGLFWRLERLRSALGGKWPLITKETARQSSSDYFYVNTKSKKVFDFEYTPLEDTIKYLAAAYKEVN